MVMNAYRNYTSNVSAMKNNLEKLSSGYKINRAGDDAAGLAISEKMRAQITGLETAQKNAKDGISLVQTAEGALTEVHDMLNRMVELATQSANGTYDNETDRYQLQKEMDQLKSEINRIADSSNFNGIKLLDGSMDTSSVTGGKYTAVSDKDILNKLIQNTNFIGEGATQADVDGGNGILETEPMAASKAGFEISLDNIGTVEIGAGEKFNLVIGNETKEITLAEGTYTASGLAKAIVAAQDTMQYDGSTYNVTADGNTLKFVTDDNVGLDTSAKISWYVGEEPPVPNTVSYKAAIASDALSAGDELVIGGTAISITTDLETDFADAVSVGDYDVQYKDGELIMTKQKSAEPARDKIPSVVYGTGISLDAIASASSAAGSAAVVADAAGVALTTGGALVIGSTSIDAASLASSGEMGGIAWTYDGTTITLKAATAGTAGNGLTCSVSGTTVTMGSGASGEDAVAYSETFDLSNWTEGDIEIDGQTFTFDTDIETSLAKLQDTTDYKFTIDNTNKTLKVAKNIEVSDTSTPATALANANGDAFTMEYKGVSAKASKVENKAGYIDHGMQNPTSYSDGATSQVANCTVDFGADGIDAWQDGAKIKIGDTTYTVAVGQQSKFKGAANVVDLTDMSYPPDANIAAQRLAAAAKDNSIFTVGHDGAGKTTLQQKTTAKESTDMSTKEKIGSYLGVSTADPESLENAKAGKALTLQIGDTADSYNQLKVDIKDCHVDAIGIGDVDISTEEGAAEAISKIKAAINYVSDVRGTLGATQNRLDHTINNLSVMTENIQDAESTIRDVDIAEEMMAYTKNNILIQASQAMLAQANQVPQGVLQLLG